jgi:chemotaxis signal transduction protein
MSGPTLSSTLVAERLRRDFDAAFVRPLSNEATETERVIVVRLGGDPYAIRTSQIRALHTDRRIVPLPGSMPELLGMATFRGQIAPVYDLAALLDYAHQATPRWLLLAQGNQPLALAFDSFQVQLSVNTDQLVQSDATLAQGSRPHLHGALVVPGGVRCPVLHLPSVLADLTTRVTAIQSSRSDDL